MNPVIYRDTVTYDRILIPQGEIPVEGPVNVVEVWVWNGVPKVRGASVSSVILERYYRKEEL